MWKTIDTPKRKADYRYKYLRLLAAPPSPSFDWANGRVADPLPVRKGDIAQIWMRRSYGEIENMVGNNREAEFGKKVLELRWQCPNCRHRHELFIPESWLEEGKAEFVEQEDDWQI